MFVLLYVCLCHCAPCHLSIQSFHANTLLYVIIYVEVIPFKVYFLPATEDNVYGRKLTGCFLKPIAQGSYAAVELPNKHIWDLEKVS